MQLQEELGPQIISRCGDKALTNEDGTWEYKWRIADQQCSLIDLFYMYCVYALKSQKRKTSLKAEEN